MISEDLTISLWWLYTIFIQKWSCSLKLAKNDSNIRSLKFLAFKKYIPHSFMNHDYEIMIECRMPKSTKKRVRFQLQINLRLFSVGFYYRLRHMVNKRSSTFSIWDGRGPKTIIQPILHYVGFPGFPPFFNMAHFEAQIEIAEYSHIQMKKRKMK